MVQTNATEREQMNNISEFYTKASQYWMDSFDSWTKAADKFAQQSRASAKNINAGADIFELYTKASKYWMDISNSWVKTTGGFPQTFRGLDIENWFKPSWNDMAEWTRMYTNFTDMTKMMPLSFASVKDINDTMAKGMNSYVKIYNAWLKGMDSIAREGYEISQKASAGEEVETAKFFDTLKSTYEAITASMVESVKDTPFAGLNGLEKAVKESLASLPEEQETAREFLQELFNFTVKMTNLSTELMKEVNKTSAEMLAKGTISGDGYKNLIDTYRETVEHSAEILREKAAVVPGYKDIADDATSWAKANLDLSISWLEMNLKLYQGIGNSTKNISKTAEELFNGEKISSVDEIQKRWTEAYQQASDTLVKDVKFSENISKFMSSYAEWMKSTNNLYRSVMTPPYVAKEDLEKVSSELKKVTKSVGKKVTAKVEAEEKVTSELHKVNSSVEKKATAKVKAEEK